MRVIIMASTRSMKKKRRIRLVCCLMDPALNPPSQLFVLEPTAWFRPIGDPPMDLVQLPYRLVDRGQPRYSVGRGDNRPSLRVPHSRLGPLLLPHRLPPLNLALGPLLGTLLTRPPDIQTLGRTLRRVLRRVGWRMRMKILRLGYLLASIGTTFPANHLLPRR